jgi:hypothetical protein
MLQQLRSKCSSLTSVLHVHYLTRTLPLYATTQTLHLEWAQAWEPLEAVGTWTHLANKRAAYSDYTRACSAAAAAVTAAATAAASAQQHTASAVALRATADALEAVSVAAAHAAAVTLKAARDAQTAAHEVKRISACNQCISS